MMVSDKTASGKPVKGAAARLVAWLENHLSEEAGHEHDGFRWAVIGNQAKLAEDLGISRERLNRIIKDAPFRRLVIMAPNSNRKITLLRIGSEPCLTDRQRALMPVYKNGIRFHNARLKKHLERRSEALTARDADLRERLRHDLPDKLRTSLEAELKENRRQLLRCRTRYRQALDTKEQIDRHFADSRRNTPFSRKEYGCLRGLAEDWGEAAPELLKRTLTYSGWAEFVSAAKLHMDGSDRSSRHYHFPSLPFMRRYWFVAVELALDEAMARGAEVAEINQLLHLLERHKAVDAAQLTEKQAA